jgi:hypothetical protein
LFSQKPLKNIAQKTIPAKKGKIAFAIKKEGFIPLC